MLRLLTYHRTEFEPPASEIHVLPQHEFEMQLDLLLESGIRVADAHCLSDYIPIRNSCAVALTFDDGAVSDIYNARKLFQRGINGIFFVSTALIDTPGYLSKNQLIEMRDMGMLIGSHSHEHRALNLIEVKDAELQMATSKFLLEDWLGAPIDHIAFPGGGHNKEVVKLAIKLGYRFMFSTIWGLNRANQSIPLVLRRDTIVQGMSSDDFLDLLHGKHEMRRRSIYWIKQMAHLLLPRAAYGVLRRHFIHK